MKLAVSQIAWSEGEDDTAAELLLSLGVKAVELVPKRVVDLDYWKAKDLEVVAMQALLFGTQDLELFAPEEKRARLLEHLCSVIDLAASLSVPTLVFGSPANRRRNDLPYSRAYAIALEFFAKVAGYAHQQGCVFCVEANPSVYACDFITTSEEAIDLVDEVNSPGLGIHLDTGGMLLNSEDGVELVTKLGARLQHLHLSAPYLAPIYDSAVSFAEVLKALSRAGYSEAVSIEMKGAANGKATREHLAQAVRFIESLIQVTE